ncbi:MULTISPECIES: RNase P modulator RnpM [Sinobaca]|uniref:YlxR domain-containing protein n=1 Tax=Sinobaca qinghaiensis TaxID=342944 RepID=A0A419V5W6_9BACL|nr:MULTISPECIES: YlxR family protein [Sinobaca]RKD75338.1 hypothetical protein ATL39_1037 [Sinobaca qinghaiensis]
MKRKPPIRKCIVSGESGTKKELVRIVRDTEGYVSVDFSGKKNGRGAYLTNEESVFLEAKKRDALSRHLKVSLSPDDYDRLLQERNKGKKP